MKNRCRFSCLNCCVDDDSYTFGSFPYQGGTVTRDCEWIVEAPQLVQKRRTKWCNQKVNGAQVSDKCPVACGDCSGDLENKFDGVKQIQ